MWARRQGPPARHRRRGHGTRYRHARRRLPARCCPLLPSSDRPSASPPPAAISCPLLRQVAGCTSPPPASVTSRHSKSGERCIRMGLFPTAPWLLGPSSSCGWVRRVRCSHVRMSVNLRRLRCMTTLPHGPARHCTSDEEHHLLRVPCLGRERKLCRYQIHTYTRWPM